MRYLLIGSAFFIISSHVTAQKNASSNIYKSVAHDTSAVISSEKIKEIAIAYQKQFSKAIPFDEKIMVDQDLRKLSDSNDVKATANMISAKTGMMLLAGSTSKNSLMTLSAASVAAAPDESAVANNFGAMLRMIDSIEASIKILLYAKSLEPSSPSILTNLGTSLFEKLDDKDAEVFFKRALKINNRFKRAREGLILVYVKRNDMLKVWEELIKGVEEVSYSGNMQKLLDVSKTNEKAKEERKKAESKTNGPTPPPSDESSGSSSGSSSTLVLPPFPGWTDLKGFIMASNVKRWSDHLMRLDNEVFAGLKEIESMIKKKYDAIQRLPKEEMYDALFAEQSGAGKISYEQNKFAMDLMWEYIKDKLEKVDHDYYHADSLETVKLNKTFETLGDAYKKQSAAIYAQVNADKSLSKEQIIQLKTLMTTLCQNMQRSIEDYFGAWKQLARTHHQKTNDLLMEYWVYSEQYLNKTFDPIEFKTLNAIRRGIVITTELGLTADYSLRQIGFQGMKMAGMANAQGDCPSGSSESSSSDGGGDIDTEIPTASSPPCPFKNGQFKIEAGPFGFGLGCESVEYEFIGGVAVSYKKNFKTKDVTVFLGGGIKTGFKAGPVKGEMSFKDGWEITSNKDGKVTNLEFVAEVKGKLKTGIKTFGGGYEVRSSYFTTGPAQWTGQYLPK